MSSLYSVTGRTPVDLFYHVDGQKLMSALNMVHQADPRSGSKPTDVYVDDQQHMYQVGTATGSLPVCMIPYCSMCNDLW